MVNMNHRIIDTMTVNNDRLSEIWIEKINN